jgi:hypothetical protein
MAKFPTPGLRAFENNAVVVARDPYYLFCALRACLCLWLESPGLSSAYRYRRYKNSRGLLTTNTLEDRSRLLPYYNFGRNLN